jgi:hypothetical protein
VGPYSLIRLSVIKRRGNMEEYLDDINDIFPFIPRGEYKRVKDDIKKPMEIVARFTAHEKLYKQQKAKGLI